VVNFVLGKLLSGELGEGGLTALLSGQGGQPAQGGLDLGQLLGRMGGGQTPEGLTQELAESTGLDPETARSSLEQVFGMLGSMPDAGSAAQGDGPDLDGMADLLNI
jgi:hypothetical protein